MKNYLPLIFLSLFSLSTVNAQFYDDFSDGNFTSNPSWAGENTKFNVQNGRLYLNAPAERSTANLYLSSSVSDSLLFHGVFGFDFNPSSSNNCTVHLLADHHKPESMINTLYMEIGSSADDIKLKTKSNEEHLTLLQSKADILDSSVVHISIDISLVGGLLSMTIRNALNEVLMDDTIDFNLDFQPWFFVLEPNYTSTRSDKFWFDNLSLSGLREQIAPKVDSAIARGLNSIALFLSEEVSHDYDKSEFNVEGRVPDSIVGEADSILLFWTASFANNSTQLLSYPSFSDKLGNSSLSSSLPIHFLVGFSPKPLELIISELMIDPSPSVGLPETEYIELFNTSNQYISSDSFTLYLNEKVIPLPHFLIAPETYLLLIPPGETTLDSISNAVRTNSTFQLPNQSAVVSIIHHQDMVDSLAYNANWFLPVEKNNGGWSLEIINPGGKCLGSNNYRFSESEVGGTPGMENSIFEPNFMGPKNRVEKVVVTSNSIRIHLNFEVDSTTLSTGTINLLNRQVKEVTILSKSIELQMQKAYSAGEQDQIIIAGFENCMGQKLDTTMSIFWAPSPSSGEIIISEIMFDPSPNIYLEETEYLELLNPSLFPINLYGTAILGDTIWENLLLEPGSTLVLHSNQNPPPLEGLFARAMNWSPILLTNSGKEIYISNNIGDTLFALSYSPSMHSTVDAVEGGVSLELRQSQLVCLQAESNWMSSANYRGGSPGEFREQLIKENKKDLALKFIERTEEGIQLHFSKAINPNKVIFHEEQPWLVINSLSPENLQLAGNVETNINITVFSCEDDKPLHIYKVIENISDGEGLIINEVLFNSTKDECPEYIELYNNGNLSVDLSGIAIEFNGSGKFLPLSEQSIYLEPDSFFIISNWGKDYASCFPNYNPLAFLMPWNHPQLNNSEGSISLYSLTNNELIDRLEYNADMHFSGLSDVSNVALERINPNIAQNPNNWTSAGSLNNFGTPGRLNSQYLAESSGIQVKITPEVISPNGDGMDDIVAIELENGSDLVSIEIYNAQGIRKTQLTNNRLLGSKAVLYWDGTDDNGVRVNSGIYLVAIRSAGSQKSQFASITVH
ncbi:lamin tail domain-containing protein [Luteibaculum oceani]|uniref:LTD domain-containing protein n=1 Tax=Luteibaculum oceani TaxID=1294296 RepID=A0A5C6VJY3_9FLAO|nr:lamin tail domain-containing protein [Luteibaculum oceani]TXC85340.1 hypothetical protein FRX97_01570 [Luteibaculum oceani]